jgi:hypothetical protein
VDLYRRGARCRRRGVPRGVARRRLPLGRAGGGGPRLVGARRDADRRGRRPREPPLARLPDACRPAARSLAGRRARDPPGRLRLRAAGARGAVGGAGALPRPRARRRAAGRCPPAGRGPRAGPARRRRADPAGAGRRTARPRRGQHGPRPWCAPPATSRPG